jgi:hypothetical protein
MTNVLEEITLGREAIEYITESLRDGQELSQILLKAIKLETGSVLTYLPTGTARSSCQQFRLGGVLRPIPALTSQSEDEFTSSARVSATPNLDSSMVSSIRTYLDSRPSPLCLFENHLAKPDDSWLGRAKLHNLIVGTTVCHYLTSVDSLDAALIELTVRKSRSIRPPLIAVLTRLRDETASIETGSVAEGDLKEIAERTEQLIVGAYDGEGYLVWRAAYI